MIEVIDVRFRGGCKSYYFDPSGLTIKEETPVIVETAQGIEFGNCAASNHIVKDEDVVQPLRKVVRIATDADVKVVESNRKKEREAFEVCEKKIADHALEMNLVRVEYSFEGSKIIFFFTADGRVDFRELVRDLASVFHTRIELRQIGVRDETKMLGGIGICGRPLCCSDFLTDFIPVSIKMAKTQNLSLNPTKISGACGRLMCCLKYEQDAYEDAAKRLPKAESFVQTPDGLGNVSEINYVKEEIKVRLDNSPETLKTYKNCEVRVLRQGKGSREGIEIPNTLPQRAEKKTKVEDNTTFETMSFVEREESVVVPTNRVVAKEKLAKEVEEEKKPKTGNNNRQKKEKIHISNHPSEKQAKKKNADENVVMSITDANPSQMTREEQSVVFVQEGQEKKGHKGKHRYFHHKKKNTKK